MTPDGATMCWGGGGGSRRPSGEHSFKYWEGCTQWGEQPITWGENEQNWAT